MFRLACYSFDRSSGSWYWDWLRPFEGPAYEFAGYTSATQSARLTGNSYLNGNVVVREVPDGLSDDEMEEFLPTHDLESPHINP